MHGIEAEDYHIHAHVHVHCIKDVERVCNEQHLTFSAQPIPTMYLVQLRNITAVYRLVQQYMPSRRLWWLNAPSLMVKCIQLYLVQCSEP